MGPIMNTDIIPDVEISATQLTRGKAALEAASDFKVVRITRHSKRYIVVAESNAHQVKSRLISRSIK
jgi:hypothetical protein